MHLLRPITERLSPTQNGFGYDQKKFKTGFNVHTIFIKAQQYDVENFLISIFHQTKHILF